MHIESLRRRPLRRRRKIREDNINMNFREVSCEDGRCVKLAQDRVKCKLKVICQYKELSIRNRVRSLELMRFFLI
jgi:hypothetical protein